MNAQILCPQGTYILGQVVSHNTNNIYCDGYIKKKIEQACEMVSGTTEDGESQ